VKPLKRFGSWLAYLLVIIFILYFYGLIFQDEHGNPDIKNLLSFLVSLGGLFIALVAYLAAKDSAIYAKKSAEISAATQRPRFVVASAMMSLSSPDQSGTRSVTMELSLKNIGPTPAEITRQCIVTRLEGSLDEKPRYPVAAVEQTAAFGRIIGPGEFVPIKEVMLLTRPQLLQLASAEKHLWLFGYLGYRDYLDEFWTKGFIGVVGSIHPNNVTAIGGISLPIEQPPTSAKVQKYTYTTLDFQGEAEATGVAKVKRVQSFTKP
jgi:hypothetical protein